MESSELSPFLIRIHAEDNVAVLGRTLAAGERFLVAGCEYSHPVELPLGHKIALRMIVAGEKIRKYGAPIGSASREIRIGEHVHLHNIQSDYLPTYTLDPKHRYGRQH
jgi:hypothetical protein